MSDTSGSEQQEPSMEEILASIRRIIAEDNSEDQGESEDGVPPVESEDEPDPGEPVAGASPVDDVLELTDVVDDEEPPAMPEEPEPQEALEEDVEIELAEPEEQTLEPEEPQPEPEPGSRNNGIMSDARAQETSSSFAALASAIGETTTLGEGDKTIEQLVKELLRPMLKSWLDQNLPTLVQRMVKDEIERVAMRSRER